MMIVPRSAFSKNCTQAASMLKQKCREPGAVKSHGFNPKPIKHISVSKQPKSRPNSAAAKQHRASSEAVLRGPY